MNKTLLALAATWMLLPPHGFAGEVRVHALMMRGPVPAVEKPGTEGWALSDPDPEGEGPRQVLVIQVVR
jgi:hypothetical protein